MHPLTPAQRQFLKARAHSLQPVVMIGGNGLTPSVLKEVERALAAHELVKIKAASDDADTRRVWLAEICEATACQEVQRIGKVLVVYRPAPEPGIVLPK